MHAPLSPADTRRPDLDWLRVVAILLLHVFHTGMMFNSWDWHVKSPTALTVLEFPMKVLHLVRMPLLMLIAGAGTAFALRRRTLGAFTWDRTKRLFLPLLVGMLVVVPPQVYTERHLRGQFPGSYAEFYPSVFEFVPYPAGSFSWHHLWFVAYLFSYCLMTLPLMAWLRTASGEAFLAWTDAWLGRGWNVLLFALPLGLVRLWLREYPETGALFDDPKTVLYYGLLFLFGHLLGRSGRVWERLVELRRGLLVVTLVIFAVMAPDGEFPLALEVLGVQAFVWSFLLTALAWARVLVRTSRPWLAAAQERAYPFYIFHQTVIILAGASLLHLPVGPWTLFALVLSLSFLGTCVCVELVARAPFLRPLFGMQPARARARTPVAVQQASGA